MFSRISNSNSEAWIFRPIRFVVLTVLTKKNHCSGSGFEIGNSWKQAVSSSIKVGTFESQGIQIQVFYGNRRKVSDWFEKFYDFVFRTSYLALESKTSKTLDRNIKLMVKLTLFIFAWVLGLSFHRTYCNCLMKYVLKIYFNPENITLRFNCTDLSLLHTCIWASIYLSSLLPK